MNGRNNSMCTDKRVNAASTAFSPRKQIARYVLHDDGDAICVGVKAQTSRDCTASFR